MGEIFMKNYSKSYKESKTFILSYKIENGKLIIKLASGELYVIPYSNKNEQKILSKMEKQVRRAKLKPMGISNLVFFIPAILIISRFFGGLIFFGASLLCVILIGGIIIHSNKMKEVKKLNYFLEYKELLNKDIEKSENVKLGISKKANKEIEVQKSKNKPAFTINNMDNYSLKDLQIINENICRLHFFGFDEKTTELDDIPEEKGPVLKRALNKENKLY